MRHRSLRARLLLSLLALFWLGSAGSAPARQEAGAEISADSAASGAEKLRLLGRSAASGSPFGEIRVTEAEANSYVAYEWAGMFPPGVSQVRMTFRPSRPQGSAVVDFDKVKETFGSPSNPLADYLLRGVHTVAAEGIFTAAGGIGQFQLEAVSLDGVPLPQMVVDFLIDRYLKRMVPQADPNRPFRLPFAIDKVIVEEGFFALFSRPASRVSQ